VTDITCEATTKRVAARRRESHDHAG